MNNKIRFMKFIDILNKKTSLFFLAALSSVASFAQESATTAETGFSISTNTTLTIIVLVLLSIILLLSGVTAKAVDVFTKEHTKKISIALLLMSFGFVANAQDIAASASAKVGQTNTGVISEGLITIFLGAVILVELMIIGYLLIQIRFLTGIEDFVEAQKKNKKEQSLWDKFNQFKPIEEESSIDIGHNYDGIRELDNATPPWFTIGFALSILFAIVYIYRFEIAKTAPNQLQEFETEMQKAKEAQAAYEKLVPQKVVDVNNLTLLDAAGIAKGKEIFVKNCATCHANDGGGGAGPNLVDDYWIHGGSLKDIFVSVSDGYSTKGMPAWKSILKPAQVEELTSYIKSLKGSKPAAPKDAQGDLFTE